jgi:tRNA pseudouridine38-40 synthase
MYPAYNKRWFDTHEAISQKGYEDEISRFKEIIYEHIAETERKEGQMALFVHSLNDRNYADFATARDAEKQ